RGPDPGISRIFAVSPLNFGLRRPLEVGDEKEITPVARPLEITHAARHRCQLGGLTPPDGDFPDLGDAVTGREKAEALSIRTPPGCPIGSGAVGDLPRTVSIGARQPDPGDISIFSE